jgi:hypothetical protein
MHVHCCALLLSVLKLNFSFLHFLLQVFSMSALEVFRDDEMEVLLCGAGEHWTPQQLADSMKFDHGYTAQSTPVRCAGWGRGCLRVR